jgi:T5orf172 domain
MNSYIYLIQDGQHAGTDIYKVGRTTQKGCDTRTINRLKSYSSMTVQKATIEVNSLMVNIIEKKIIQEFNKCFTLVKGREWFSGDFEEMKKIIYAITNECAEFIRIQNERNLAYQAYIQANNEYETL